MIFFTADTHFYHANIIKYCSRPFVDREEMNEQLITRWNNRVQPDDLVYHLGDIAFCREFELHEILNRLNGNKILIMGNHDRTIAKHRKSNFNGQFYAIHDQWMLHDPSLPHQNILLSHYPKYDADFLRRGGWMLHGHTHGTTHPKPYRMLDVGVDVHGFQPIALPEVAEIMAQKEDYHFNGEPEFVNSQTKIGAVS